MNPIHSNRFRFFLRMIVVASLVAIGVIVFMQISLAQGSTVSADNLAEIESRLREVGISDGRYLQSTGINTHLERLRDGEITLETLQMYANQLDMLSQISAQYGQTIPVDVWDVQTADMQANNFTEYEAVSALVDTPYADLLGRAYNRLYDFKQNPNADTAMDTALDLLVYTADYVDAIHEVDFEAMDADTREATGMEIIGTWQRLIGSAPRINPLTDEPLFPYHEFAHFNATEMWRYHTGRPEVIGDIWGVSGFDERFVGESSNINQVEHMAVSASLQYTYETPVAMLNAVEVRDNMSGRQSKEMTLADQTVNNTIDKEFLPRFEIDFYEGIAYLRCALGKSKTDAIQCRE